MLIYLLTNTINGKQYVGQTTQPLRKRLAGHRHKSSAKTMYVARAIQKYGWENFEASVLTSCSSQDELNEQEVHFVLTLGTMAPKGYNLAAGGGGTGIMSLEARKKIGAAHRGKTATPETRKRLSDAHKGIRLSEEAKAKLRTLNAGKRASQAAYDASVKRNAKTYTLVNPEGVEVVVHNLKRFCQEHGLPYIAMHDVTSGRSKTCLGWKASVPVLPPPVKQARPGKTYTFTDPEGATHTTNMLPAFCREHGLNYTAMLDLSAGRKAAHKGWRA